MDCAGLFAGLSILACKVGATVRVVAPSSRIAGARAEVPPEPVGAQGEVARARPDSAARTVSRRRPISKMPRAMAGLRAVARKRAAVCRQLYRRPPPPFAPATPRIVVGWGYDSFFSMTTPAEPYWPCPTCNYDLLDELDAWDQTNVKPLASGVVPGTADGPASHWCEWAITCPVCETVTECSDSS
jgi:hypothetical protein